MQTKMTHAQQAFLQWKGTSLKRRIDLLRQLKEILHQNRVRYATLITQEMGKPITQSLTEVDKCGLLCDYYAHYAESFLEPKHIVIDSQESFVTYEPLGVV